MSTYKPRELRAQLEKHQYLAIQEKKSVKIILFKENSDQPFPSYTECNKFS